MPESGPTQPALKVYVVTEENRVHEMFDVIAVFDNEAAADEYTKGRRDCHYTPMDVLSRST